MEDLCELYPVFRELNAESMKLEKTEGLRLIMPGIRPSTIFQVQSADHVTVGEMGHEKPSGFAVGVRVRRDVCTIRNITGMREEI